jgi:predicted AlkP superfamily pyrophosphatase or phosphodiesterase
MTRLRLPFLTVLIAALALSHAEVGATRTARPVPAITRALIVSVDGLRPDLISRAHASEMEGLMKRGTFTLWARTTDVAVTLPSHVSMLTGVPPSKHGITWNSKVEPVVYPLWPTLFEVARASGYTTAMATGKSKFIALEKPGTLDWAYVPGDAVITDEAVADTATDWIARFAPEVMFVHLPSVDLVGHDKGWGSPQQIAAVQRADRCVGRILDALRARGLMDSTVVILSADHGGSGKTHGADVPRSHEIPWIVSGPGIVHDRDLTKDAVVVRTEDTFATVCWLLGITPPKPIDGHPITRILESERHVQRRP